MHTLFLTLHARHGHLSCSARFQLPRRCPALRSLQAGHLPAGRGRAFGLGAVPTSQPRRITWQYAFASGQACRISRVMSADMTVVNTYLGVEGTLYKLYRLP